MFYMAALLYPTDAKRNIDKFASSAEEKESMLMMFSTSIRTRS